MRHLSSSTITRRGLFGAGGALGLGALLAACGGKDDGKSGGSWSFTDDRGQTAKTDGAPKRIVAFVGAAAALHDLGLGDRVVGVFGPTTKADGSKDVQAGDLDVAKVTVVGNAWGEFNIEQYAALKPDLLVSNIYRGDEMWYVPEESKDKIFGLAPQVGLKVGGGTLQKHIDRYTELAKALGADLNSSTVTGAKGRWDAAVASLKAAAQENPGVRVLACSGDPDMFYASNPGMMADLAFFKECGVEVIVPAKPDDGGYFETISWENADRYPADLLLLDDRTAQLQPADLAAKPAWAKLPAVKANQITPWSSEPRYSYAGCAPLVERLAAAVKAAKKVA
ncbi:ABC transporter substrate-binding protein [Actinorhabdospora filicis]|uniref:ABC transporter substrate-binding protein n=1 Tax=Actinorhabdospora filicis TaxID=1785913 RepID=A0A9W6SNF1_9ACTN|nr:ABC transporter substrate-binding protein [Actinorhabdospora filicis]GLZ79428.1 ABC transporter substrate-binding protein [Actinorhabdospora filicis]